VSPEDHRERSGRHSVLAPATATAALFVPLAVLDRRMQATGGPGIVPFELAGPGRGEAILARWGDDGRRAARASLVLDFPFLLAYTLLNVRLTRRASSTLSDRGARPLASLEPAIRAVQIGAGACDAIENAALLGVLARGGDPRLSGIARGAARAKFAGLAAGWAYGAVAVLRRSRGS
jgi:hypothetical protein